MLALEQILVLFAVAVLLAAAARRVGAPYPVFLAVGGALLAFVPGVPSPILPPDLVLALFVAPVLLDAAYDASLRDLRDNWAPLVGLVVFAVLLTTAAVAAVAHALVAQLPWAAAVALGAIVAPPDAVAATAVLRTMRPPRRVLTILEGESLLNDATALLVFRLALAAVAAGRFSPSDVVPAFLLGVIGSIVAGPALGWLVQLVIGRVQHVPTAILLQFLGTFAVWLFAERVGLSGVLTTVCFAMTLARTAPARTPARIRIPTNAVWATVVFALNVFAFIFIGLQMRPIVSHLSAADGGRSVLLPVLVLLTVIVVRMVWHLSFNAVARWQQRRRGFHPPRPMMQPSFGSGLVISWAGMRGIVTLAGALALPPGFPERDLLVLCAFAVVLGTLLIQGLTMKPMLRALRLPDDDPVVAEVDVARDRVLAAALDGLPEGASPATALVRKQFALRLGDLAAQGGAGAALGAEHERIYRAALARARRALLALRDESEIGDDAFHALENELDWMELSDPLRAGGGAAAS